jgi:hypothetical protein
MNHHVGVMRIKKSKGNLDKLMCMIQTLRLFIKIMLQINVHAELHGEQYDV